MFNFLMISVTSADPGFPVGGGMDPLVGGMHLRWGVFQQKCLQKRKNWVP